MNLIQIAAFLKRKVKALRYCDRDTLMSWLEWHAQRKSLAYAEVDGKVVAAGMARQVNETILKLMKDDIKMVRQMAHYMTDDEGPIVYAEHAASSVKGGLSAILLAMKCRFPTATTFAFSKCKSRYKHRFYDTERFVTKAINQA